MNDPREPKTDPTESPHLEEAAASGRVRVVQHSTVRHPLGLPAGSVRALLTVIVVLFLVIQTARGVEVSLLWHETLMIVLAHYFTTRRFVPLSRELKTRLEAEGRLEADDSPLYLPRYSIRTLIVAAFTGLAVYLYREGRLLEAQAIAVLGTVGAYFLGILFKVVLNWWAKRFGVATPAWWGDLKAIVALLAVLLTVSIQFFDLAPRLPFDVGLLADVTLGLILFYFGSR